jgi:NADPH2:quinone reductase
MRVVMLHAFGPPQNLVVEVVPDPAPGPGQVLVAVHLANVTFVETQIRAGHPPHPAMTPALPVVLGNGVGGTVSAVGPDVDRSLIGRRVVTTTGGTGGYAEKVVVDAANLVDVPGGLGLAPAVALLADGRTALALVEAAALRPGDVVLVEAAAGGVGSLLVPLAVAAGATVIAAVGGRSKAEVAARRGPSVTVDYGEPGWADEVRRHRGSVDVVFDGVGGEIGLTAFGLLRQGGRFCSFGMASGSFTAVPAGEAQQRHISVLRGVALDPVEMRRLTVAALDLAVAGHLHPLIGQTFPLAGAADAHGAMAARATVGKTLLVVTETD